MIPANRTFTLNNGKVYAGRLAPAPGYPSWRPAPGFFADVSLNTLADVAPSGWPLTDIASPFSNWSGNNYNDDIGPLGGTSNCGSGHLALATNAVWAGINNFDAFTRLFFMSNVPPVPISDASGYDANGEIDNGPAIGFPNTPHTYGGTLVRSAAAGGGPKGSLVRINFPGSSGGQSTHEFDITLPGGAPSRVITGQANAGSSSYPCACLTEDGKGFYSLNYYGQGPMRLYEFGTVQGAPYTYTTIQGSEFNVNGDSQMALKPGPNSCLVATTNDVGNVLSIFMAPVVNRIPGAWRRLTVTGPAPADRRCGLKWSRILQCFVTINGGPESGGGTNNAVVHRLNPPVSGLLTVDPWFWTTEIVVGLGGAVLSRTRSNDNGTWGNLVEAPKCGTLFFCNSIFDKMQALTLQGM